MIAKDNIEAVMNRTVKLEVITEKALNLKFGTNRLSYTARKIRQQAWRQKYKMYAYFSLFMTVFIWLIYWKVW